MYVLYVYYTDGSTETGKYNSITEAKRAEQGFYKVFGGQIAGTYIKYVHQIYIVSVELIDGYKDERIYKSEKDAQQAINEAYSIWGEDFISRIKTTTETSTITSYT